MDDLIPILSLYIAPEGPITKLVLDLGPLEFSQSLITAPEYVEHLESRYCSLDEFNRRFQTHFKNLSALTTQSGSKIADGKRPWLFAHDYQWCRQQIVENYLQEIVTKKIPDRVRSVLVKTAGSTKVSSSVQSKLGICFESTLIQVGNSNSLSPLMIGSQISSSAVQAFQWASSCFDLCKIRPVDFTFSHLLSPQSFGDHPCGLVITGKYMQNKQAAMLGEWVNQGKHLFFPMGVPQFDENLESFDFNAVGNRTVVKFHGIDWFKVSKSGGFFYCPVQTSVFQSVGAIEKLVDTLISQHQGEING
ncbi:MAG: hypothetical protein ACKOA8_08785 [Deltaproteobacteria bacterium]